MGNRADRRASAKIARQAVKRARSPTEAAILRAAGAFANDDPVGQLGPWLSDADFDDAWARLTDDLHDILMDRYPAFLVQAYAEAGLGALRAIGADGAETEMDTRLFLCPMSGPRDAVAAFAGDADEIGRLERSLLEFGVVPDGGRCLVLPFVLPLAAFAPDATPPGRVRGLHDDLSNRLVETLSGAALPSRDAVRDALSGFDGARSDTAGIATEVGALIGVELLPIPRAADAQVSQDELDAEDMARSAAIASWYDSYAAEMSGLAIGAPLDWPACAGALAWETIRIPMEAALLRRAVPDGRPEIIHCALADDGERFVVSAVSGSVAVGPFFAPSALVWLDADEFFERAEASAATLMEHDGERDVVAPLLGSGGPHPAGS